MQRKERKKNSSTQLYGYTYLGMHIHVPEGKVDVYMYWLMLIHMNVCSYPYIYRWVSIKVHAYT